MTDAPPDTTPDSPDKTDSADPNYVGVGLALGSGFGTCIGAVIGAVTGDLTPWIPVGVGTGTSLGIVIGVVLTNAKATPGPLTTCPLCEYSITGLPTKVCPECGGDFEQAERDAALKATTEANTED